MSDLIAVAVGDELPPLDLPLTRSDVVRYSGASTDFNPIHYNDRLARAIGLPGVAVEELHEGRLAFRHIPTPRAAGEIAGHLHPRAVAPTRAGGVARPCFVSDGRRVLMPAFGAYTGGQ